jgi:hypothetical protein
MIARHKEKAERRKRSGAARAEEPMAHMASIGVHLAIAPPATLHRAASESSLFARYSHYSVRSLSPPRDRVSGGDQPCMHAASNTPRTPPRTSHGTAYEAQFAALFAAEEQCERAAVHDVERPRPPHTLRRAATQPLVSGSPRDGPRRCPQSRTGREASRRGCAPPPAGWRQADCQAASGW